MEFRILDKNFIDRVILDQYESLLWVDRYNKCGDFELYTPPTDELLEYAVLGNYIYSKESEHLMIIEHQELNTSFEEGARLIIKGRSIESILDRRVLWYKTQFRNNLEDGIRQILDYSIIDPANAYFVNQGMYIDEDRKIDNFIFEYSGDSRINKIAVNLEFEIGTSLLTVIQTICKTAGIGFKITLNSNNQFVFQLYMGINRSYNQFTNPWVVFSKRFNNLITDEFANDNTEYKNAVRIVGDKKVMVDGQEALVDMTIYGTSKGNILEPQGGSYQINDYEQFSFKTGKLSLDATYTFTSKIEVNEGTVTQVPIQLTGDAPYTRIYASKNFVIQNGRITGTLKVVQPDPNYDDCLHLRVYSGSGNIITLTNPIFTPGDTGFVAKGLERREFYQDGSSVEKSEEMTDDEYLAQLQDLAYDTLDSKIVQTKVNGTAVEDKVSYTYGTDYHIGDIVQVENDFGILGTMRVTEFITSHSTSGLEMYPTFTSTTGGEENDDQ